VKMLDQMTAAMRALIERQEKISMVDRQERQDSGRSAEKILWRLESSECHRGPSGSVHRPVS